MDEHVSVQEATRLLVYLTDALNHMTAASTRLLAVAKAYKQKAATAQADAAYWQELYFATLELPGADVDGRAEAAAKLAIANACNPERYQGSGRRWV